MKTVERELPQALSEYFERTLGDDLAGKETVSNEVKSIYKQLISFEESKGVSVITRTPFGSLHALDTIGVAFSAEDGTVYKLNIQGEFLVWKMEEGRELKKIQKHNQEVSRRQGKYTHYRKKYLPRGKFESISPEEFIKAYLETVETQSDASNRKLKPLRLVSAKVARV